MLHSLFSLLPGGRGGDRPRRSRRGGRSQGPKQVGEHLGKWIWLSETEAAGVSYLQARKAFELNDKPEKAVIKACAETSYKLYLNGMYVGRGPVPGGQGLAYFDTHDVTHLLQRGRNVIAFLVHCSNADGRKPGLICKTEIEAGDRSTIVESDETWRMRAAAEWADSEDGSFVFDARALALDWMDIKCREREWHDATVVGEDGAAPWGDLVPRQISPLTEMTVNPGAVAGLFNTAGGARTDARPQLAPLRSGGVRGAEALASGEGGAQIRTPRGEQGTAIVLDFGRIVCGEVEIGIAGSGRGVIALSYLDRFDNGHTARSLSPTDRILLDRGRLAWQGFGRRAFRFLLMEFRECARPVEIDYVRVNEISYQVPLTGSFACSDHLLNDVWNLSQATTRLCMGETFVDSPGEAGMSWSAARIASRVAYYAFGDAALLAQSLRQIALTQNDDGSIPGSYPTVDRELVPDSALFWVFSILDCFAFSGDPALLHELYPRVDRLMHWFGKFVTDDGLLSNVPGRIHIDSADVERRGSLTALNCLYYQALQVAALIAGIAGREEDAEQYMQSAAALRLALNKHLYLPKRGLYAECRLQGKLVEKFSRQANVLAVLFDIPDHYQKATIYRLLAGQALPELETPYFASHYLEALYAGERHEEALGYMRRKWGPMAKPDSGTAWELFTGEGRAAHAGSVCPARDLIAEYVGIKPIPGSQRFAVAPHTGDLDWARGTTATPAGPLTVDWRRARNSITIALTVPEGVRVDVYPPCPPDALVSVNGKPWPSRLATLGHGEHLVRATAPRTTKPSAPEEPQRLAGVAHVEILDGVSQIGRRLSMREGRPRTRRRTREHAEEAAEPVVKAAEVVEVEKAAPLEEPSEIAAESQEPRSRRPRRRSRRSPRRRAGAETAEQAGESKAEEPQKPAEQPTQPEQQPPQEQPAPTESEQKPARRRRRSYRRRRPSQPPTE